jgi:hypothetical protein
LNSSFPNKAIKIRPKTGLLRRDSYLRAGTSGWIAGSSP